MKKLLIIPFLFLPFITFSQNECDDFVEQWYLDSMKINGELQQIPINEEVINIVLDCPFNSDNIFLTTYCQTGTGTLIGDGSQYTFENEEFTISGESCETSGNLNAEALFFSFFTENIDQTFLFSRGVIDWTDNCGGTIEDLYIQAPNGDYLIFYDCPRELLNTHQFDITTITISPNPVKETLQIHSARNAEIEKYQLFNAQGQLLVSQNMPENYKIDVSQFNAGLYFLKLTDNDRKEMISKIIVE